MDQSVAPALAPLRVGALTIDAWAHEVHVGDVPIALTLTQFRILEVLASHAGQTLTRDEILDGVGDEGEVFDRTLDRHIANLRARIEPDPAHPRYIVTVFGVGYKLVMR